jgi:hypothetical protein
MSQQNHLDFLYFSLHLFCLKYKQELIGDKTILKELTGDKTTLKEHELF